MVHFMSTWLNCTVPRCLGKCYPSCVCDSVLDKVNIWSDRLRKAESESEVAQLCPTLSDTMDCSLLGSSVHGILQASVLEWGAIAFSRRSCRPRDRTQVSCIVGSFFTVWATSSLRSFNFQASIFPTVSHWFQSDRQQNLSDLNPEGTSYWFIGFFL